VPPITYLPVSHNPLMHTYSVQMVFLSHLCVALCVCLSMSMHAALRATYTWWWLLRMNRCITWRATASKKPTSVPRVRQ